MINRRHSRSRGQCSRVPLSGKPRLAARRPPPAGGAAGVRKSSPFTPKNWSMHLSRSPCNTCRYRQTRRRSCSCYVCRVQGSATCLSYTRTMTTRWLDIESRQRQYRKITREPALLQFGYSVCLVHRNRAVITGSVHSSTDFSLFETERTNRWSPP